MGRPSPENRSRSHSDKSPVRESRTPGSWGRCRVTGTSTRQPRKSKVLEARMRAARQKVASQSRIPGRRRRSIAVHDYQGRMVGKLWSSTDARSGSAASRRPISSSSWRVSAAASGARGSPLDCRTRNRGFRDRARDPDDRRPSHLRTRLRQHAPARRCDPRRGRAGLRANAACLNVRRLQIGAWAIGLSRRALDMMCTHVKQRTTFGAPLADRQAIQWWVADAATRIHACRLMVHNAAARFDSGEEIRPGGSNGESPPR